MTPKRIYQKTFDRWIPNEKSTRTFQVFQKYNNELEKNIWAFFPTSKEIYKNLGKNSAKWTDKVESHFEFTDKKNELYNDLQEWSNSYKQFDNWVNLNVIMSISANFETYLASVISLALKSNPGIIFGASKMVDGITILKNGAPTKLNFEEEVIKCTKGDWSSRIASFEKIFGEAPELLTKNVSSLEQIRKLRNKVGHSFGRDIEEAREHAIKKVIPTETISRTRTLKYQSLLWSIAKSVDIFLLENHIGTYQALNFYHTLYQEMRKDVHPSIRAVKLKTEVGRTGVQPADKVFYKSLVNYYENL